MSFALYLKHGPSFGSNKLYADTQAVIKTAFWCVAQQKLLNKSQPWYMFLLGDEQLKEMFVEV
jgi:hypothetical protein